MDDLDKFDLCLLAELQQDGRASNAALGEVLHLSPSQVSRRVQRLREKGAIDGYAALLRPAALGLGVTAYISVALERHQERAVERFNAEIGALSQVLECYSLTGEPDYLLRVVVRDLEALSEFTMHKLLSIPGVRSVRSNVVLQQVKRTTALPLEHLGLQPRPRKAKEQSD